MKFRLLGIQEQLLDDTEHLSPESLKRDGYNAIAGPIGGTLYWSADDLLRLADYAYVRAEANSSGCDLEPSHRTEVRSLFALAKRIRKAVCKEQVHVHQKKFLSALGMEIKCPCACHAKGDN